MTGRHTLQRRVAALVTDRLAVELAQRARPPNDGPLAVIIDAEDAARETDGDSRLDAVNRLAWQCGARPGQTAAEAAAYVARLAIVHVPRSALHDALAGLAEVAMAVTPLVALELEHESPEPFVRYPAGAAAGPHDTVWLDITGCSERLGGEEILCAELRARTAELGHHARVAIADGPRLAQALARWGDVESVAPPGQSAEAIAKLPLASLPLESRIVSWLAEVGLWTVGDLATVERSRLAHRLGTHARDVLELIAGRDDMPLRPYEPERRVVEHVGFEEPLTNHQPLLFVVRGMVARASARLGARGEASGKAVLELVHDRAALSLAAREGRIVPPLFSIDLGLPVALAREDDLLRAIQTRVEKLELTAPIGGVSLILDALTRRAESQLDLSNLSAANPDALPTLLAQLCAAVGRERVGVLEVRDSHRPEARSVCVPVTFASTAAPPNTSSRKRTKPMPNNPAETTTVSSDETPTLFVLREPTRMLQEPVCIGSLRPGALLAADRVVYLIKHLRLSSRLEGVEWWSVQPISRDYARGQLQSGLSGVRSEHAEAWVFHERTTGRAFLHGWFE